VSLQRKVIRRELARVLDGNTVAGSRISTNRSVPAWTGALPAIGIFARSETIEVLNEAPRIYVRALRIGIELFVERGTANGEPIDDQVDDLAAQVEALVLPRLQLPELELDGLVMHPPRSGFEGVETEDDYEGETLLGAARLTFVFAYLTEVLEGEEEDLDRLKTVAVDWDFAPPDGELEASDAIHPDA